MEYVIGPDRRTRKRQAVHQSLLDAAGQLFREHGVQGTTIDDIAEAADVARQTVFNHFPYKEAIAVELAADGIEEVTQRAHALLESGAPALEVLQRTSEWLLDEAIEEGELAVVVARELLQCDPDRVAWAAQQIPLAAIFEAVLTQAREEGSVRDDLPLDVVAARLSAVFRTILLQVTCCAANDLRRDLAVCFDVVFNGIKR